MTINIIDINFTPLGHRNNRLTIYSKQVLRKQCIKTYQKKIGAFKLGTEDSFAYFCPISIQYKFMSAHLLKNPSNSILILSSLQDVAATASVSVACMINWLQIGAVQDIFITGISTNYPFSKYANYLQDIYVYPSKRIEFKESSLPKPRNTRLSYIPNKILEYAIELRSGSDPVLYGDISKATGISHSSLKRIGRAEASDQTLYTHGRPIKQKEVDHIAKLWTESYNAFLKKVEIFPDIL